MTAVDQPGAASELDEVLRRVVAQDERDAKIRAGRGPPPRDRVVEAELDEARANLEVPRSRRGSGLSSLSKREAGGKKAVSMAGLVFLGRFGRDSGGRGTIGAWLGEGEGEAVRGRRRVEAAR